MRLICAIELEIDPKPWSVPEVCNGRTRTGRRYRRVVKDKKLDDYQQKVSEAAEKAMDHMSAFTGPIRMEVTFYTKADPKKGQYPEMPWLTGVETDGEGDRHKKGRDPDLTNLEKAWEDGIEGHPFVNDVQVVQKVAAKKFSNRAGVVCHVYLLEEGVDFPEKPSDEEATPKKRRRTKKE